MIVVFYDDVMDPDARLIVVLFAGYSVVYAALGPIMLIPNILSVALSVRIYTKPSVLPVPFARAQELACNRKVPLLC